MKKKSAILLSGLLISSLLVGCQDDKEKEKKVEKPEVLTNLELDADTLFKEITAFQKTTNELNKEFTQYSIGYSVVEGYEKKQKQFTLDATYPTDDNYENDLFVTVATNNFDIEAGNDTLTKVNLQDKTEAFYNNKNGQELIWEKDDKIIQLFSSNNISKEFLIKLGSDFNATPNKTKIDLFEKDLKFPTLLTKDSIIEYIRGTETEYEVLEVRYKLNSNYKLSLTFTNDNYQYHSSSAKEVKLSNGNVAYLETIKNETGDFTYITWKEQDLQYHLQLSSNVPVKDILKENQISEEDLIKMANSLK